MSPWVLNRGLWIAYGLGAALGTAGGSAAGWAGAMMAVACGGLVCGAVHHAGWGRYAARFWRQARGLERVETPALDIPPRGAARRQAEVLVPWLERMASSDRGLEALDEEATQVSAPTWAPAPDPATVDDACRTAKAGLDGVLRLRRELVALGRIFSRISERTEEALEGIEALRAAAASESEAQSRSADRRSATLTAFRSSLRQLARDAAAFAQTRQRVQDLAGIAERAGSGLRHLEEDPDLPESAAVAAAEARTEIRALHEGLGPLHAEMTQLCDRLEALGATQLEPAADLDSLWATLSSGWTLLTGEVEGWRDGARATQAACRRLLEGIEGLEGAERGFRDGLRAIHAGASHPQRWSDMVAGWGEGTELSGKGAVQQVAALAQDAEARLERMARRVEALQRSVRG